MWGTVAAAQSPRATVEAPPSLFPIRAEWTLALNNQLSVPPVYSGMHGYFAITGDRLVAYDLEAGRQLWIAPVRALMQPAAGDGLVFIVEESSLTAMHGSDGSIAWRLPAPGTLAVPPVWADGWLVVALDSGDVLAYRAMDGHLVWRQSLESPAHARPSLAADRVDVPLEDGRIVALTLANGEPVWERRLGGPATALLAAGDRVFAGSTDNFLYALDANDGHVAWRWRTGADVIGVPAVDEHRVYFVSLDNVLRALSRKSGVQQWARPLPIRPTRGPLVISRTLVVSGVTPTLRAFNDSDGRPAGDVAGPGELAGSPYAVPNSPGSLPQIVVVTHDIAKGATVTLFARQLAPALIPSSSVPPFVKPVALEP